MTMINDLKLLTVMTTTYTHGVATPSVANLIYGEFGDADSDDMGESESVLSLLCPDDNSCASDDEYSALCSDSGRSTGPMQDDSDEDADGWDPENDPQFEHNENSFEDDESSGGPAGVLDGHTILPPAFSEHRALLNGYIHVFVNAAYKWATHSASEETLTLLQSTIKSCYPPGQIPPDYDINNAAHTLRTVERRLGVSTDKLITNYVLCPSCWKTYHPSQLQSMNSAMCTAPDCSTAVFRLKRIKSEGLKKVPLKVMPVASFKMAL
ncbi:hypothetical protein BDN67DRAFT_986350, partial [Paxillus ammoniavirescens]